MDEQGSKLTLLASTVETFKGFQAPATKGDIIILYATMASIMDALLEGTRMTTAHAGERSEHFAEFERIVRELLAHIRRSMEDIGTEAANAES